MLKYKLKFSLEKRFCIFFFFVCLNISLFGQNIEKVYQNKLKTTKADTAKLDLYLDWTKDLLDTDPSKIMSVLEKAKKIPGFSSYRQHEFLLQEARYYYFTQNYTKATKYALDVVKICDKLPEMMGHDFKGRAYELISSVHIDSENLSSAIYYQKLALDEYKFLADNNKDEEVYYQSSRLNLARLYNQNGQAKKAIAIYNDVEQRLIQLEQHAMLYYVYSGLAACYDKKDASSKKLDLYQKSLDILKKYAPEDISSKAFVLNNIGTLQEENQNYVSAIFHYSEALEIFKKLKDRNNEMTLTFNLAMVYQKNKQFEQSSQHMLRYVNLKDSIFTADTKQTIHDLSIKYETEKKEQENKLLQKDNEKKRLTIYFAIAGIFLVVIILGIIFRNNRIMTKVNKQLEAQNKLIEEQHAIVEEQRFMLEEKNKEITDSIKYAERIQGAILPPDQKWNYILPKSFVLNKPKDILSGDFYWIAETERYIFCAAADCTGHGVPGALISIVNFNLLNKAVLERHLESPSEILDAVNDWLTESLNQTKEQSTIKDGMDIALIRIEKSTKQVVYSGANNPLYLFSKNELIEVKADKFPVGAYINEEVQRFSNKEIPVGFGDTIYLFSDGYADQFGGPDGKKYKYKQFKETLFSAKDLPISQQKDFLHRNYRSWRADLEQTDDILIIGIQF